MSGETFSVLANYKVIHPHAITLDLPNERVYWVDSYMNYIEGVDYNGKERVTIKRPVTVSGNGSEIYVVLGRFEIVEIPILDCAGASTNY